MFIFTDTLRLSLLFHSLLYSASYTYSFPQNRDDKTYLKINYVGNIKVQCYTHLQIFIYHPGLQRSRLP